MNHMNLIPMPVRMARSRRRRIRAWSVCVVAAVIILCIPILFDQYRRVEAARLTIRQDSLVQVVGGLRRKLAALTVESERANLQLQRAKGLRSKRAWSAMLMTIARSMPDGCWLTSISTDPSRPTGGRGRRARRSAVVEALSTNSVTTIEAPQRLKLVGFASDPKEPYQFVTNMKAANVFSRVSLKNSILETKDGSSYLRFDLECEW